MVEAPFYPKLNKTVTGFNIVTLLQRRPTKGDIGLEIEMEGNKFPKDEIVAPWAYHKDGSLRGQDNAEYVLKAPIEFNRVPEAVDKLFDMLKTYGSKLDESNRTSVHVHLNVQKFHLNRLTAFLALYFSVEELLTAWCGEHRVGNLFCLRARDATAIVSQIRKFIASDGRYDLREHHHYAGLNANALYKFGSLEIRTLRGVSDPQIILDWVSVLQRLYELSKDFPDPREITAMFSSEGPINYLGTVLGDKEGLILSGIDYNVEKLRNALYDGIRLAQDLCYCRDWSLYKPCDLQPDPFGRSPAKLMMNHMPPMLNGTGQILPPLSLMNFDHIPTTPGWGGPVEPLSESEDDGGDYEDEYNEEEEEDDEE